MKTVVSNRDVVRLWTQQTQEYARSFHGTIYFRGTTIYSYGDHFPMARLLPIEGVCLCTTRTYSVTTAHHLSLVHSVCRHEFIHVEDPTKGLDESTLDEIQARIDSAMKKLLRSRVHRTHYVRIIQNEQNQFNAVASLIDSTRQPRVEIPPAFIAKIRLLEGVNIMEGLDYAL